MITKPSILREAAVPSHSACFLIWSCQQPEEDTITAASPVTNTKEPKSQLNGHVQRARIHKHRGGTGPVSGRLPHSS